MNPVKNMINPFEEIRVSEPRRAERAVTGLNDAPLQVILNQFDRLKKSPLPRKDILPQAQFVISPEPGYGKSHMIGRLFKRLSRQATLIYIKPFENASNCWKSILHTMVQEMDFPDDTEREYGDCNEPTQLEALSYGILKYLLIDVVQGSETKSKASILNELNRLTIDNIKTNGKWLKWIQERYDKLVKRCSVQLRQNGIPLAISASSWLRILFTYTCFPADDELRDACLDWLKGGSIATEHAQKIGIKSIENPSIEMPLDEANELYKSRILDFCSLAGFFRPFVFCFDQTENYGKEIILSKTLGIVIQVLTDYGRNQMTMITANQHPWEKSIEWWEHAHRQRLSMHLELEGLNRSQAEELIRLRFERLESQRYKKEHLLPFLQSECLNELYQNNDTCDIRDAIKYCVFGQQWLDELFPGNQERGVRDFLTRCSERWKILLDGTPGNQDTIPCYFESYLEEMKTQTKRHVFDLNAFEWLVKEVAAGISNIRIEPYQSPKGHLSFVWNNDGNQYYFGFETGSNWMRWQAIMKEAKIHYEAYPQSKTVFFRTSDLPEIPGKWKIAPEMESAKNLYLHIFYLKLPEIIELYTAYDVYRKTVEGDTSFQRQDVMIFIRKRLSPLLERIRQPLPEQKKNEICLKIEVSPELIDEIRTIVQRDKFLSVDAAMKKLSKPVSVDLFHRARGHIAEIKVYPHPNATVLQWQSKP